MIWTSGVRSRSDMREKFPLLHNEFEKGYFKKQVTKILEERETELNALYAAGEFNDRDN